MKLILLLMYTCKFHKMPKLNTRIYRLMRSCSLRVELQLLLTNSATIKGLFLPTLSCPTKPQQYKEALGASCGRQSQTAHSEFLGFIFLKWFFVSALQRFPQAPDWFLFCFSFSARAAPVWTLQSTAGERRLQGSLREAHQLQRSTVGARQQPTFPSSGLLLWPAASDKQVMTVFVQSRDVVWW